MNAINANNKYRFKIFIFTESMQQKYSYDDEAVAKELTREFYFCSVGIINIIN